MIHLPTTADSLIGTLAAAHTTTAPVFVVAWADHTVSSFTPGDSKGLFNGASEVTLCAAPGASTYRMIKSIFLFNMDTVAHTMTVRVANSTNRYSLIRAVVIPNAVLQYSESTGWTGVANAFNLNNFSVAAQVVAAASRTYLTGSSIAIPVGKLRIGTILRWAIHITKTGAGTAASTYDIAFGTTGTTTDTARVSFAKPAGTGVIDTGLIDIVAIVRGPLSASGVVVGTFRLTHNLASTGHAIIPGVAVNTISAAFDVTTPTFVGVCLTSGALDAITTQQVVAEALNL